MFIADLLRLVVVRVRKVLVILDDGGAVSADDARIRF